MYSVREPFTKNKENNTKIKKKKQEIEDIFIKWTVSFQHDMAYEVA